MTLPDHNHYYVYYLREGDWVYERTCGTEEAANDRVNILIERDGREDAKWTLNEVIKGAFY